MKTRVRVVLHFVGIMKVHVFPSLTASRVYCLSYERSTFSLSLQSLRENFQNFNSYLAILSAIESSPVSRLDWPERVVKSLEEPRALIDNKGSFKNYREAFARAKPPCIPYM